MNTSEKGDASLLLWLVGRGDSVCIHTGRLMVSAASGKTVEDDWIKRKRERLGTEISTLTGMPIFQVVGHSVGNFDGGRYPGLHLQLRKLGDDRTYYTVFNVETARQRTTPYGKKGQPSPPGQFWIGERHALYQFWQLTGLPMPRRKGAFSDYLGKLRPLYLTGVVIGEKVRATSLKPVDVTVHDIILASKNVGEPEILPDNSSTFAGHLPDNCRTIIPDKQVQQSRIVASDTTVSSTWADFHERSNQGRRMQGAVICGLDTVISICPEEQSVDEWLAEYENTPPL